MSFENLQELTTPQLADLARDAMTELARRGDHASFTALLSMSGHAGGCVSQSARALAESGSWSQVADLSGTTKQAAWSKWSQSSG